MWNRMLDKIEAVLQWLVWHNGDKVLFWVGWYLICASMIREMAQRFGTGHSPEVWVPNGIVFFGGYLLWFIVGKLVWVGQQHPALRHLCTESVLVLGGYAIEVAVGFVAFSPILVTSALPGGVDKHPVVISLMGLFEPMCYAALPLGASWTGYRIGNLGWVWGSVVGLIWILQMQLGVEGTATSIKYCLESLAALAASGIFGYLGELLAKRGHHELPAAPHPPTTNPAPAAQ